MEDASRIVCHQNLHLALREGLHVEILRSVFLVLAFRSRAGLFVPFVNEYAMLRQVVTSPGDSLLCRGADEVAGSLFVARAQDDRRIRSGRYVFLEAAANLHELRQTLH